MATATVRVVDVSVFLCSCESIQCLATTTAAAAIIIFFFDDFLFTDSSDVNRWNRNTDTVKLIFFLSKNEHNFIQRSERAKIYYNFDFWFYRIFRRNTSRAMLLRPQLGLI